MKRWRVWLAVLAAGTTAGLMVGGGMNRLRGSEWPAITEPAALRREASALCAHEGGWRELLPSQYPPAMTRLHPASISVSGARVYIGLVPVPGGARFRGYYVWPDGVVRADGGIVREESNGGTPGS